MYVYLLTVSIYMESFSHVSPAEMLELLHMLLTARWPLRVLEGVPLLLQTLWYPAPKVGQVS